MTEETLFHLALEKQSPEERAAFLDQACAGRPQLRAAVEALLAAHEGAGSFLDEPPVERGATTDAAADPSAAPAESPGARVGPYKLLQKLGEGGMGTVFLAEQTQPVQRRVALKVIKAGMDSAHVLARFEAERQALALMDHPNIAKVLDAGATEAGRPYFVMELVKGVPVTTYCDQERLTPRERLELFVPVCQAVQHAHQKGVIHRDLKPSNVLVALYDGRPVPKVIDFGVAKATGPRLTGRTLFTEVGQVVGTLEYMSPEQAELNQLDIDTRSDVYALGVLLYELLTGSTPFTVKQLRGAAFAEMLRMIREVEPPRPSTKLSGSDELPAIAAKRKLEPKRLARLMHGELDWIVMKCLEKERGRRYETANALALDLRHYLADEPVAAGPPSAAYRLRKFLRRNKGPALAAALVLLALVGGVAGTTWGLIEARGQRDDADRARTAEAAERGEAEDRLARLYVSNGARHLDEGDWLGSLPWFAEALRLEQADPERALVHRQRLGTILRHCPRLVQLWPGARWGSVLSPDGRRLALVSGERSLGEVGLRDLFTGETLRLPPVEKKFLTARFSPDGRYLLARYADEAGDPVLRVYEAATGQALPPAVRGAEEGQVSPDGSRLVTSGPVKDTPDKKAVRLWDVATGTERTPPELRALAPAVVVFGPAGRFATVTGTEEAARVEIRVWAADTGAAVGPPVKPGLSAEDTVNTFFNNRRHFVPRVAFRPDGERLATAYAKRARVWDVATGKPVTPVLGHDDAVSSVQFSQEGSRLFAAAGGKVHVWDPAAGKLVQTYPQWTTQYGTAMPGELGFEPKYSPDSRCVLLDSRYQARLKNREGPRAWDLGANRWLTPMMKHAQPVAAAEFAPDGRRFFTINQSPYDEGGEARLWDLHPAGRGALPLQCWAGGGGVCLSPDGRRVVADTGQGLQLHDIATGQPVSPVLAGEDQPPGLRQWPYRASCMGFSADGRRFFVVRPDQGPQRRQFLARVYDVATGAAVGQPLLADFSGLAGASASADGSRFLLVGAAGDPAPGQINAAGDPAPGQINMVVRLWDTRTGQPIATLSDLGKDHLGAIEVAFSPDGRLVVGLFYDESAGKHEATPTVRLWEAATGRPVPLPWNLPADRLLERGYQTASSPDVRPKRLAFSPDGQRVAFTWGGNRAYLCPLGDEAPPVVRLEHHQNVNFVAFSPDGGRVVTVSDDLTARVWDAATGSPATPPLEHESRVLSAAFRADGRLLATLADDHTLRVWDLRTGAPVTPPLPATSEQVALSADGRRLLTFAPRSGWGSGDVQFWDISPDTRPVEDLVRLGQLLSGHHIDSSGALVPLDARALHDAWDDLRARYPDDFTLSEKALLAWHREEATAAEGRADWAGVVFHVGRLLLADPGQPMLYLRRGRARADLGQHEAARADYSEAIRLEPGNWNGWAGRAAAQAALKHDEEAVADYTQVIRRQADNLDAWFRRGEARARLGRLAEADADFVRVIELQEAQFKKGAGAWHYLGLYSPGLLAWYDRALCHLARDDDAGYREVCEAFLRNFREAYADEVLGRVAWTCALAPAAVKDLALPERLIRQPLQREMEQVRRMREGRQALPAPPAEPDLLTTAAALAYRRDDFKQTVTLLTETRELYGPEGSVWDWLFLAMAHQRLGHGEKAGYWLRRAAEWTDRFGAELAWNRRLELQALRREAERLVK